ncbi:MAG: WXG100 family type VII secretion target [Roseburia sp.]|nr:WXG100 family type VII secretion target [Roseburia sp.]
MAEKIKINTKTLQKDNDSILKDLKQVQKKLEAMQSDVAELNSMWSGEANKAFNQAFNKDIKALAELCSSLEGIAAYEDTARSEYDKCEKQVESLIAAVNI